MFVWIVQWHAAPASAWRQGAGFRESGFGRIPKQAESEASARLQGGEYGLQAAD
ncbi:hypothetical protein GCM10011581_36940 [Saccharopolyspora subtropica]|uniref:Uncharacterized protein n=1 Tax=Saccharopolyspora thermophila TaxID=89367 RepID=A0A917K1M0_9PSEU|nr:hypothetical protein GCM10011581_36940 [Saccharopolyspora subtropica]